MDLEELLRSDTPPKIDKITDEVLHKLFWKCKGLLRERERSEAFWTATNKNLRIAYEKLDELVKELQETREELHRKERLAMLGQLVAGVGHELRNPLGAIKNAVYFLNMVFENPEPEVEDTLKILQKEVEESERIISSLLDFPHVKPPTLQKVDVNDVVREALSRIALPETIGIVSQLDDRLPVILADPGQIRQVFANIALNAIQAMPKGGQLTVMSEHRSPGWVTISFSDTGVGISQENMRKIFEPLFTTKAKGIGLGLAIAKSWVEAHDGKIEVQSELGKGSTFTIDLPATLSGSISESSKVLS